jgi:hypothetical membrane protein
MTWRRAVVRVGAGCGIIAPGLGTLINGIVAALQTDYNSLQDYISDLSAPGVPYSGLIRGWWLAFPFVFAPFICALYVRLSGQRFAWCAPSLLAVAATALGLCGIFPCDPGCRGLTLSARTHFILSDVVGIALVLSPLALGLTTRNEARWRAYHYVNLLFLSGGIAVGVALFAAGQGRLALPGLYERLFYGVFYIWFILIALHLLYARERRSIE